MNWCCPLNFCPSDTFVKPNLWLLVNPNIACPIQYGENAADLQTLSEPAQETQAPLLDSVATQHQAPTELHMLSPHDAVFKEDLWQSVSSSTEYMVQYILQVSTITEWSHAHPHGCMRRHDITYSPASGATPATDLQVVETKEIQQCIANKGRRERDG